MRVAVFNRIFFYCEEIDQLEHQPGKFTVFIMHLIGSEGYFIRRTAKTDHTMSDWTDVQAYLSLC